MLAKQSVDDLSFLGVVLGVPVPSSPRFVPCSDEKRLVSFRKRIIPSLCAVAVGGSGAYFRHSSW
jgi:hypothetical protein